MTAHTMATLARNEKRESLRYSYTPDERREKGQQLADTHIRLGSVTEELDRIKSDYKAKIQTHEAEISTLSTQVSTGYEMREYVCFYEYDTPARGKKTLRRKEPPCDVVRVEEMTESDRQTVMESIEQQVEEQPAQPGAIVPFVPRDVTPAGGEDEATVWNMAIKLARAGAVSTSKLQRELKISYNEAAAIMERLRDEGIIETDPDDDELAWSAALEEQRKANAKEAAEKAKASKGKGRRTSTGGVVATEADGKDITTEDDSKSTY